MFLMHCACFAGSEDGEGVGSKGNADSTGAADQSKSMIEYDSLSPLDADVDVDFKISPELTFGDAGGVPVPKHELDVPAAIPPQSASLMVHSKVDHREHQQDVPVASPALKPEHSNDDVVMADAAMPGL
jgi:hypothetical protein